MNKPLILLLTLWTLNVVAQELPPRTISMVGFAERSIIADKATFTFAVLGLGPTLRLAVDDAKSKIDKMSKSLYALGFRSTDLQTEEFGSGENSDKGFLTSSEDFRASVKTVVTIDSLELLEPAILALSDHKPESISNVTFVLTNLEQIRREVQIEAVRDARIQADKVMKELGTEVRSPYSVETTRDDTFLRSTWPNNFYIRGGRAGEVNYVVNDGQSFIGAKSILIKEVVRVVFQY